MAAKRGNGEGGIYKRMRDGRVWRYEGSISYTTADGSRKRHTVYAHTRADCLDKMKQARERVEGGAPVRDAAMPLGAWLEHWRNTTLAASDRKPSTKALYANLSRKHLEPEPFGATRLNQLTPSDVEALVLRLRAKTKPGKPTGDDDPEPVRALSDSTIRQVYTILRAGLDGAVRDGLLARNPAAAVKRPGVERNEVGHLDAGAVAAVLKAAETSRYYPAVALVALTGMRRGEVLALRWDRVDLDAGVLRVAATISRVSGQLVASEPKTARSRRTVPLSPAAVTLLREQQSRQTVERQAAGTSWADKSGLVFTTERGTPVDPRNVLRVVEVAAKTAGVEGVGVHTLRHSAAVAWLERGVHIKAVADLLGHSSVAITGDVYGHTSDDTARAAVDVLGEALGL